MPARSRPSSSPLVPGPALRRLLCGPVRWLPLALLSALLPALLGALLASCGEEADRDDSAPARPDAGMACERGTQGCACSESNACFDGLLCSVGRCLPTEGRREPQPEVRVPRPVSCLAEPCDPGLTSSN